MPSSFLPRDATPPAERDQGGLLLQSVPSWLVLRRRRLQLLRTPVISATFSGVPMVEEVEVEHSADTVERPVLLATADEHYSHTRRPFAPTKGGPAFCNSTKPL